MLAIGLMAETRRGGTAQSQPSAQRSARPLWAEAEIQTETLPQSTG
jgi:hypothetical protein